MSQHEISYDTPLVWFDKPDGSPDWEAARSFARAVILDILTARPGICGEEIRKECNQRGVATKLAWLERMAMWQDGLIRSEPAEVNNRKAYRWWPT